MTNIVSIAVWVMVIMLILFAAFIICMYADKKVKRYKEETNVGKRPLKVFISLPMNGRPDSDIQEDMKNIMIRLGKRFPMNDLEMIDTFSKEPGMKRHEMLLDSMSLMDQADIIYFAQGYLESPGCYMEYKYATLYHSDQKIITSLPENTSVKTLFIVVPANGRCIDVVSDEVASLYEKVKDHFRYFDVRLANTNSAVGSSADRVIKELEIMSSSHIIYFPQAYRNTNDPEFNIKWNYATAFLRDKVILNID